MRKCLRNASGFSILVGGSQELATGPCLSVTLSKAEDAETETGVETAHKNCLQIFKAEFFYSLTVSYVSEFKDH